MEKIKQKSIELLLNFVSKEYFEELLYNKVKTEDVLTNKLLFNLVCINYKDDNYKEQLLINIKEFISEESIIIYTVNLYSEMIINEIENNIIFSHFNKIYNSLFDYEKDYGLMWDFYDVNERISLLDIKYEKEEDVVKYLKEICTVVCHEFNKLTTIDNKIEFLINGIKRDIITDKLAHSSVNNIIPLKKWYQFWK